MTDLFEENAKYYKLQDGSAFAAKTDGSNFVVFDVNGPKKPNKNGQDLWVVKIKDDGTVDDVEVSNTSTISTINTKYTNCKNGTKVHGCIGKFLRNGFKIQDSLN